MTRWVWIFFVLPACGHTGSTPNLIHSGSLALPEQEVDLAEKSTTPAQLIGSWSTPCVEGIVTNGEQEYLISKYTFTADNKWNGMTETFFDANCSNVIQSINSEGTYTTPLPVSLGNPFYIADQEGSDDIEFKGVMGCQFELSTVEVGTTSVYSEKRIFFVFDGNLYLSGLRGNSNPTRQVFKFLPVSH